MLTFCSTTLSLTRETVRGVINVAQITFFGLWGPQQNIFYIHLKTLCWNMAKEAPTQIVRLLFLPWWLWWWYLLFSDTSSQWSRGKRNVKQMSSWVCKHSQNPTTASMLTSVNITSDGMLYCQPRLEISWQTVFLFSQARSLNPPVFKICCK